MTTMWQWLHVIRKKWSIQNLCVLCSTYHRGVCGVCTSCQTLFKTIKNACIICNLPLLDENFKLCGRCIRDKPAFDKVYTRYVYEEPLRTLMQEFKYREGIFLDNLLSDMMLEAIPSSYQPDCLVPVPMHATRLRQRGFNQAAQLAKILAKKTGIPCQTSICQKIIHTNTQVTLNRKQRQKNLRNAFTVSPNAFEHIVIVDDLLTTGSTVEELAKALKKQGAKQVDVWCCARAGH